MKAKEDTACGKDAHGVECGEQSLEKSYQERSGSCMKRGLRQSGFTWDPELYTYLFQSQVVGMSFTTGRLNTLRGASELRGGKKKKKRTENAFELFK